MPDSCQIIARTSSFGVGRREGHDASAFYRRGLSQAEWAVDTHVNEIPADMLGRVFEHSSEQMSELPDNSVALVVTSPPYHVGKEYDGHGSFQDYLVMIRQVLTETYRVLEPGGRTVVNVANLGRRPYIPLSAMVTSMAMEIGFFCRGEVIWVKAAGAAGNCAWGLVEVRLQPNASRSTRVLPVLFQRPNGQGPAGGVDH